MDRPAPPKMHGADSPTKITKFTDHEKAAAAFVRAVHRAAGTPGARGRGYLYQEWTVEQGDSTPLIHVAPVPVFQRPADLRRYRRLVDAVKKVYPIAKTARAKMAEMEAELLRLPTKKEQKAYIKQVYDEIKDEYTPVLKHMTRTQGRVLLKLIDRETDRTAYDVLREFRGGFVADSGRASRKSSGRTSSRPTTRRAKTASSNRS